MKRHLFMPLRAMALLAAGAVSFDAHGQCNVYMTQGQQVIDGFGFSTAWCGTLTSAKNQSLYGTLGMSLLRIQIVNDVNGATSGAWNDGANNAAAAHSYGVKVFGSDWYGPNGWDDANLYLLPQYYGANAVFLAKCAQYSHLDWVSPSNEPDLGWQMWTTNGFIQWTTKYGASIGVPLIMPESCWFSEPYSQAIADNPNVPSSLIPIAAGHSYGVSAYVHSAEIAAGKHVWMTEYYLGNGQDQVAGEAVPIAQNISQYMNNQFNAYVWWWVYTSDTVCNLVENNGNIHKNGYAMGQFAKWIRPGSTKVAADFTPQANVNVTAYNAFANGAVVIVAVNANNNSVSQSFAIHNGSATVLEGYQTSTNNSMTDIGSFAVSGGNFTATLPGQSITTFVQTNVIPANLPPLWAAQDIGLVGIVGSTTYTNTVGTNGIFAMSASGNDIGGTGDAFRFVGGTNAGNCTLVARVSAEQSLNATAKAGVMIRSSLASNAPNAFVAVTPGGVTFQYRSTTAGGTSSNLVSGVSAPCWVKLVQSGSAFTGYYSTDGTTWTQLGTATISMSSMAYAGLAFCNNGNSILGSATIDNVSTPFWPIVPPPAPTALTATPGVEQVALTWQEAGYATNYNVLRAAASSGPYTNIAAVVVPGYVDTDLAGGTTYYYEVNAGNSAGRSTNSAPASGMPTANVLSPWVAQDIGAVNLPGSENFTNGVFTSYASGADIQNNADAFRFVYVTTNSANFTILARVKSVQNINSWSKAGVMVRDSLDPAAANAFIAVTPSSGVTFQSRSSDGGGTSYSPKTGLTAPYWVKLVGSGGTFTGYYSSDGVSWTQFESATLTLSSTVYAGLAVTSHDTTLLCTTMFDNVNAPGFMPPLASIPAGLVATAGVEQVALSWLPSSNATNYNVYRSTTSGGPYSFVANVTTTNCNDTQLASSTTYFYVVTAANSLAGESANSAQVSATTTATMPSPWVTQDIGAPAWGSARYTNGLFTVIGSGSDIWNAADSFRFVYVTTNSTSFTMIARVASLQNINAWSKAGVMIRDSLNPGAANAFIAVTPGNGVSFQYRSSDGGNCNNTTVSGSAPYWVKLVGSGTNFTGYCSPDGTTWTQVGTTSLTNITRAYIGLAVTSHNNPSLCTVTFDNVTGPGWPYAASPAAPTSLTATLGNAQAVLRWMPSTTASSYNVKRSLTNGGPFNIVANLSTTNYTDTGMVNGTTYYYVVSALNMAGESANSTQVSVTPQNPAPTGLSATALSGSQISLLWNAFSNSATYILKRSTTNGGPYGVIASGLSATNYLDTGLGRGTNYYYVVSAVVAGNETPNSTQAAATTLLPFSATWTNNLAGGTANWSAVANWNVGIPMGVGDSATLGVGTGLSTVRLDQNAALSRLSFTNANSFVIADMGNILTLDGSGSGASVNVTNGTANAIATTVSLNDNLSAYVSGGKSLSISGVISNAGVAKALTVSGPGTLALSGNNSYGPLAGTVGTALSGGGTLQLANNNALGRGDLSLSASGTLRAGTTVSLMNNISIGPGVIATVDDNGNTATLGGIISGSGALNKIGAGTVTLTNANTYTGNTTINGGTLNLSGSGTLASGRYNGVITNNGLFNYASSASQFVTNGMVGTGGLTASGTGTLTLLGTNTYSGSTLISSGTLSLGALASMANTLSISVAQGASVDVSALSGGFTLGAGQWLSGGGRVQGDVTVADDPGAWVYPNGTWAQSWPQTNQLSFGGNLSFGPSSTVEFDLSSSSDGANDSICLTEAGSVLEGNGASIWIFAPLLDTHDYVLFTLSGQGASVGSGFSSVPLWDAFEPAHSERYSIVTTGKTVVLHYTPIPVTATGMKVNGKPYDGTTSATLDFSSASLVGLDGGDAVGLDTNSYSATFASAASPAGSNNVPVTVTGLGLNGAQASKYTLTQPTGVTGNILPISVAGAPYITKVTISGGDLTLMGTNTPLSYNRQYKVMQTNDVSAGFTNWPAVGFGVFAIDGGFTNTITNGVSGSVQYFLIQVP